MQNFLWQKHLCFLLTSSLLVTSSSWAGSPYSPPTYQYLTSDTHPLKPVLTPTSEDTWMRELSTPPMKRGVRRLRPKLLPGDLPFTIGPSFNFRDPSLSVLFTRTWIKWQVGEAINSISYLQFSIYPVIHFYMNRT